MINKLKIGLLVAVLSLAVGVGSAYAATITFSTDTNIDVHGVTYTILAGSGVAAPLIVEDSTLTVTADSSLSFTLTSADGYALNPSPATTETCTNGISSVTVAAGAGTVVFTPSSALAAECPVTVSTSGHHGSSSHSGGGGGGSSSSSSSSTTASTTVEGCVAGALFSPTTGQACSTGTVVSCMAGALFSPVTGAKCTAWTGTTTSTTTTTTTTGSFGTVTVKLGSTGAACMAWQTYFNAHGAHLVLDGHCGPLTMAFAKTWQASVGLVADGMLGPKSRAAAGM